MALRVSSPVLVGRAAEMATLRAALDAASAGRATTVLVDGEAGIGKTRLVREFSDAASAAGATILRGGCVRLGRDEGLPFVPVVQALRGLLRERGARVREMVDESTVELASLLPELGFGSAAPRRADQRPDWAQTRLFEAILVLLGRLAAEAPVVYAVEDLHWADRSTLDLLTFLALNLRDEPVVIVGTYRSDELHRRHPLRAWAAELDRLPIVRISLDRLARDELRRQIEGITGSVPDSRLVEEIESRSGGNPFFVEELVAVGASADELPESLRGLLLARVGALPERVQDLLSIAAVGGVVVDHDVLLSVAGTDDAAAIASLRQAVQAQLLVPSSDGDRTLYTFRHALLQEAVYDDVLPRERRRLHGDYARAFDVAPVPTGAAGASHLATAAHHAEAAHDLPRAVAAWLRAARAAFEVHAAAESSHAYSRCLELWDAIPPEQLPADASLVDVLYEASYALGGTGDIEKAVEVARRAVELDGGANPERHAELLMRFGRTQWLAGQLVAATATLERAVALVDTGAPTPISARAVGGLASVLMLRGATGRAIEVGQRALEQAEAVGSDDAIAHALNTLGAALADSGECERGIASARRGLELATRLQGADEIHRAYANLSTALEECGRAAEAAEVALEGLEWARRRGMWRLHGAFLGGNAASALFEDGRWDEAAALLDTPDQRLVAGVASLNQAVTGGPLAVRTGRLDDAARILKRARARLAPIRDAQFTGPIYAALAELALAEGREHDVPALVDEALELMAESEDVHRRAELLATAVRAAAVSASRAAARNDDAAVADARATARRRMAQLRDLVAAHQPAHAVAHREAEGYVAEAEAELLAMDGAPQAGGWAAAASRWEALARPYRIAVCRFREGEAHLTAGERARGTDAVRAAHAVAARIGATVLAAQCERLATLARIDLANEAAELADQAGSRTERSDGAAPNAFALTDRELQILPLLASGYTNRQIGAALFISESTAGVHVSRIIGKMGVSSRVEAAAVAVRTGLAD